MLSRHLASAGELAGVNEEAFNLESLLVIAGVILCLAVWFFQHVGFELSEHRFAGKQAAPSTQQRRVERLLTASP